MLRQRESGCNVVKCSYSAIFSVWRERNVSPNTSAAGVAPSAVELALVVRFLCAAAAKTGSHDALVSKPVKIENPVHDARENLS